MPAPNDHATIVRIDATAAVKKWSLGLGAVLVLLGGLALAAPWAAATFIDFICGGTLIAAGVAQLATASATFSWRGFWLTLLCGALSVVAGTAMLVIPVEGVHVLVTFLGLVILFEAAAKLAAAFAMPGDFPWGWLLFDGVVTTLLGGLLLTSSPAQAGALLGMIVGVNLLTSGVAFAATGLWLRRATAAAAMKA
ncbi:MAG: DUF308 domain-containing protein [Planctomycetota bacterium]